MDKPDKKTKKRYVVSPLSEKHFAEISSVLAEGKAYFMLEENEREWEPFNALTLMAVAADYIVEPTDIVALGFFQPKGKIMLVLRTDAIKLFELAKEKQEKIKEILEYE